VHKAQTPRKNWTRRDGQARFSAETAKQRFKNRKGTSLLFFAKYKLQAGEAGRTGEMTTKPTDWRTTTNHSQFLTKKEGMPARFKLKKRSVATDHELPGWPKQQ